MEVTYQPAFHACIREGGARSVMCSYNAVNGVPSCGNAALLTGRLRTDWGFDGFIVSDCYAIKGIAFPGRWTKCVGARSDLLHVILPCTEVVHCALHWALWTPTGPCSRGVIPTLLHAHALATFSGVIRSRTRVYYSMQPAHIACQNGVSRMLCVTKCSLCAAQAPRGTRWRSRRARTWPALSTRATSTSRLPRHAPAWPYILCKACGHPHAILALASSKTSGLHADRSVHLRANHAADQTVMTAE